MPGFTLGRQSEIKTLVGGLVSLLIMSTTLFFAMVKWNHLYEYKSPSITAFSQKIDEGARFNPAQEEFMMAFTIEHFQEGVKDDPRFVQWILNYSSADKDGKYSIISYPMHQCRPDEMAKFYPADFSSTKKVEKFKKEGGLYCIDLPEEGLDIYGYWQSGSDYAALDILAAPCGY